MNWGIVIAGWYLKSDRMGSLSECRWGRDQEALSKSSHSVLGDFSTSKGTFLNSGREGPSLRHTYPHPGTRDHLSQLAGD